MCISAGWRGKIISNPNSGNIPGDLRGRQTSQPRRGESPEITPEVRHGCKSYPFSALVRLSVAQGEWWEDCAQYSSGSHSAPLTWLSASSCPTSIAVLHFCFVLSSRRGCSLVMLAAKADQNRKEIEARVSSLRSACFHSRAPNMAAWLFRSCLYCSFLARRSRRRPPATRQ